MKAIQIVAPHSMDLVDMDPPMPKAGEVLVKVEVSGICHTDVNILEGNFHADYPVIPGHEFAGGVVAVGEGVSSSWIGQNVVVDPNVPCGLCKACHTSKHNQCKDLKSYGVNAPGGFAEYVTVREVNLHSLGDLSLERAVFVEPLACVIHGLNQVPRYAGGKALIFGAGPMGLLMLQGLKLNGVTEVSIVDLHQERLDVAKELGAYQTFLAQEPEPNRQYDVVVDATGVESVIETLPSYTADGGSILYFGVASPGQQIKIEPYDIYRRDLKIAGSFSLRADISLALSLLRSSAILVDTLLTHVISLQDFEEGIKLVGKPSVLKAVVRF